ncbi:hypothetical protein MPH_03990 [Macrophomina phaseolina MS6]|uniref:Subtilisin-like serine protease n=2 Tax=Macrophomina phaseolina TaxID=35725 RepID=K2S8N0_MACPH|nr:hypothetical protein MPH_03990 [Macrophomina phaseolina MS6]KAH7030074.1 hypothetical protein B0J12DRAFT_323843 [Macrophomina phaseolina]
MEKPLDLKTCYTYGPPFIAKYALFHGLHKASSSKYCLESTSKKLPDRLPGHPQTKLDRESIAKFLKKDLTTPKLDRFYHWLWIIATHDSANINSLSLQNVRGREITLTQNPELHCVWHRKRIFLKPIPPFLLSYEFWDTVFTEDFCSDPVGRAAHQSALGFMRTYASLIQHPSDFALATDKGLIPAEQPPAAEGEEPKKITFEDFIAFIESFHGSRVQDGSVSLRYHYGDLRLSRLNFWAKFVLLDFTFEKAYGNYDAYFSRFYGPLLFLFGVINLVMGAMQLGINTEKGGWKHEDWKPLYYTGRVFAVIVLIFISIVIATLLGLFLFMVTREFAYGAKEHRKKLERAQGVLDDEEKGR